jgi:hypothetical protein
MLDLAFPLMLLVRADNASGYHRLRRGGRS